MAINKAVAGQTIYKSTNISDERQDITNYGSEGFKSRHEFGELTEEQLAIIHSAMAICASLDGFEEGDESAITAELVNNTEAFKTLKKQK